MLTQLNPLSRQVAKRGAKLLDRSHVDWFREIDSATLDIANSRKCVLGQLYGTYIQGLNILDNEMWLIYRNRDLENPVDGPKAFSMATWFGFDVFPYDSIIVTDLTSAWLIEVSARRKKFDRVRSILETMGSDE